MSGITINQPSANTTTPTVLVISCKKQDGIFSPYRDDYFGNILALKHDGFTVKETGIGSFDELTQVASNVVDNSISLLWIRAHGSPRSMTFSKEYEPNSDDIRRTWSVITTKLKSDATIILDSCLTGKLESYNNIQLAFADLTIKLPDVKIFAPEESISQTTIRRNKAGDFCVSMQDCGKEYIMGMGGKTKKILQEFKNQGSKDLLLENLKKSRIKAAKPDNKQCPLTEGLNETDRSAVESTLARENHILTNAFLRIVAYHPLSIVKHFVEKLHIPLDSPKFYQLDTPIFQSIMYDRVEVVKYLKSKGADWQSKHNGVTPLSLAKDPNRSIIPRKPNNEIIQLLSNGKYAQKRK